MTALPVSSTTVTTEAKFGALPPLGKKAEVVDNGPVSYGTAGGADYTVVTNLCKHGISSRLQCALCAESKVTQGPSFIKHDSDKTRFDLIDHAFERELAEVLSHGAKKYAPKNWQQANPEEAKARYYAAMRRHMDAYLSGEEIDAESGCPHLICAACCIHFLRWFQREGK